ncbi:MAG: class I SAM-dependent methyltransferase [Desulfobacterales bacterium]
MKLQELFHNLCPGFVKRLIDPVTLDIDKFIISSVSELGSEKLLLDAGAGECRFKDLLKDVQYVGVDTAWGDQSWNYSKIDVACTVDNLPFGANVFDMAICTQVLEHVKEPQALINELFRTLKNGGIVCLSAPQGWGVHQAPHDYFRFTCYALSYLLEKAGFQEISVKQSCGYYGYLANRLTVFPKTLFWQIENKWLRLAISPLEILSYFIFVGLFPLILNSIDFLDRKQNYTLNYFVKGKKINDQ